MTTAPVAVAGPRPSPEWPASGWVSGLTEPVEITRGRHGIPTIRAAGLADAMCGLGYATGRDRMFQLDVLRRRAAGEQAALFGAGAVAEDARQRRLGLASVAGRIVRDLPERHGALLESYTAGVNRAIADGPAPFELDLVGVPMRPWRPADSVLVALLLSQLLSGDGRDRRMRSVMREHLPADLVDFLLTDADPYRVDSAGRPCQPREVDVPVAAVREVTATAARPGRPVVADEAPWGSNIAAVAGSRTPDGRAVLSNDMHLPLGVPALFYRASLAWPGHRVDGVVVPGLPVVVAGCTADVAWGATRLAGDTVDQVPVDPAELTVRRERIDVHGADPVWIDVRNAQAGPVLGATPDGTPLATRWVCREPGGVDLRLVDLLAARDVAQAAEIVTAARGAPLNVAFADRSGRIGWAVSGTYPTPDRSGHLPPGSLPRLIDPPDGLIVNANNRMPEHDGPHRIADNHFGARRADRIATLLRGRGCWREPDLLAVQADTDAGFYEFYRDLALEVLDDRATAAAPGRVSLRAGIRAWDGGARPEAVGLAALVLFRELVRETWFGCLLSRCVEVDPDFGYRWHSHEAPLRALLGCPELAPAPYRRRSAFLLGELDLTVRVLDRLAPGTPPGEVRWAAVNPSGVRHPFSGALPRLSTVLDMDQAPLPGCQETVCATRPGFGPAFRMVASPGHPDDALATLPGGQSGNPADPTYRDQYPDWLHVRPAPLRADQAGGPVTRLRPGGGQP